MTKDFKQFWKIRLIIKSIIIGSIFLSVSLKVKRWPSPSPSIYAIIVRKILKQVLPFLFLYHTTISINWSEMFAPGLNPSLKMSEDPKIIWTIKVDHYYIPNSRWIPKGDKWFAIMFVLFATTNLIGGCSLLLLLVFIVDIDGNAMDHSGW